jgi:cytoskeletal protein CcmA (bactofilin family)
MAIKRPTSVVIDPIAMGITNKVAQGSCFNGTNSVNGGLLVEGEIDGRMIVNGNLVLMAGGHLRGDIEVNGDAYIFGQVGSSGDNNTVLTVRGELHLTSRCYAYGTHRYGKLAMYDGASVDCVLQSLSNQEPAKYESSVQTL